MTDEDKPSGQAMIIGMSISSRYGLADPARQQLATDIARAIDAEHHRSYDLVMAGNKPVYEKLQADLAQLRVRAQELQTILEQLNFWRSAAR